ncbi:MAG: hypothetical protein K2X91_00550, partial [Thermoleophilia bacterium]|nr:hypothetical protein [Thermoleophilia bacterium]
VNVVGPTEAMKAAVPAFSLKNVTALMALKSLEYVNNLQGDGFRGPQSYLRVVDLSQREATGGKSLMYAVSVTRNFVPPSAMASSPFKAADGGVSTQVYAVRDLLGPQGAGAPPGLTIEQIVGPLEAALNVDAEDGSAEPAKLMVHKDSNLILVRGTARQNGLVRQVLDRLREDTMALRAATGREREQARIADELQKQHQVRQRMLEAQIAEQEQHARELNAQIEKARADKRDDQALALTSALNESQAALATLRRQIAQNQLESAQVPFEASRQARITAGATGAQEIAQLRSELEAIRKELNELRAFRPGSK